jgi:phosphoenolpyruvate synthase/pyruvate phosphate dikinase
LELLHQNFGYYFVVRSSASDFGSADIAHCKSLSDNNPDNTVQYIKLLYFIRISVCRHLLELGYNKPHQILLAQIHPVQFFGSDIFHTLFMNQSQNANLCTDFIDPFPFLAIDEIQMSLTEGINTHLNNRPFFTPLILQSRPFPKFFISGTGINFGIITNMLESSTLKESLGTYTLIGDFLPLTPEGVESYASTILTDYNIPLTLKNEVVRKIGEFELCHGRPRFVTFILDKYTDNGDIEACFILFKDIISNIRDIYFPLRFLREDIDEKNVSFDRIVNGDTLARLLTDGLIDLITNGELRIVGSDELVASVVRYGLGYIEMTVGIIGHLVIQELAVIECIRRLVPFHELVRKFLERMLPLPKPQMAGYMVEYLVAFAMVAKYSSNPDRDLSTITVSVHPLLDHYLNANDGMDNIVFFPDHMCGPDIVYKCSATKTVYIVQVKFVKKMSKREIMDAADTTDPDLLYCNSEDRKVRVGYGEKKKKIDIALLNLMKKGYDIQRVLFVHSGEKKDKTSEKVHFVTKETEPDFFDGIDKNMWGFLNGLRSSYKK